MSLRTRRSLAMMASLMLLTLACNAAPPAATPTGAPVTNPPQATPTAPSATATAVEQSTPPESTPPESTPPESTPPESTPPESTPPESTPPQTGGTLRIYCCSTDPRSLRPVAASGSDEISILGGIQRPLLYYDQNLGLVPSLATELPTVSNEGLTYTYTMRPDAMYSDGTPIVAADIVRSARALADPRNAFDYGYEMCWVDGVNEVLGTDFGCSEGDTPYLDPAGGTFDDAAIEALLDGIGVVAQDEHTVVFNLDKPTSFWPNITAMWLLTPTPATQTSWAEAGDIVSSGPFMIDSWTHNSQIVLVPNPNWYGEAPKLARIEIGIGGDPAAAVAAFERGDLDLVGLPSSDVRRVLADPNLNTMVNRGPTLSLEYYDFANCIAEDSAGNVLCPPNDSVGGDARVKGGSPTQDKDFRIALTQAVDKAELIEVGFAGLGLPASTPTMPGIPDFPTATDPYPFDLASALTHMATALDTLGIGQPEAVVQADCPAGVTLADPPQAECVTRARVKLLSPLKFGYNCDAGHDQRVLYLANVWRTNLGFTGQQMDIRCTDFGTFRTERRAGNVYDIARNGWGADFPHPDNQNRDLFACGAGNNNSKYCNPEYDALLNSGATATSYEAAVPFYHQAEELLATDAPVLFMRYGEGVRLVRPWVQGILQTSSDHQNIGDVFYETISVDAH